MISVHKPTLVEQGEKLHKLCVAQQKAREIIRASKRYIDLQDDIINLTKKLEAMIDEVADDSLAYVDAKEKLILEMESTGLERAGNFVAKYRVNNIVNGARVFSVLGNDVGLLMEVATIQQNKLKDFAKGNPDIKKELLACIEENGKTITDITYLEQ